MTIREMEERSGIDRANIRYYEKEGLLSPDRRANGYRDYSEEDLEMLLKIKLLRSLQITLEEIRQMQDGVIGLPDVLSRNLTDLKNVSRELQTAQEISRILHQNRVTFRDLRAEKYLDGTYRALSTPQAAAPEIDSRSPETASFSTASPSGLDFTFQETDLILNPFCPWRRYFARTLDFAVYQLCWTAFLVLGLRVNLLWWHLHFGWTDVLAGLLLMAFLEPLFLHFFGVTPGKWVFGISIRRESGGRISLSEAGTRTLLVLWCGLACWIPIYSLVRLWTNYKAYKEGEFLPWENPFERYRFRDQSAGRFALWGAVLLLLGAAHFLLSEIRPLPPNRGELTVEQFAENVNYYSNYLDIGSEYQHMNKNGQWVEKLPDDVTVFPGSYAAPLPHCSYTLNADGFIEQITVTYSVSSKEPCVADYYTYQLLASLGYAGAGKDSPLLPLRLGRLEEKLSEMRGQNCTFTKAGAELDIRYHTTGYLQADGVFLFLPGEVVENYLFQMDLQIR